MDASQLIKNYGVALTGGIATGKSTVAQILRRHGYLVIDADQLARDIVAVGTPGLAQVLAIFGPAITSSDGSLDRRILREMIMQNPLARQKLEAITHPLIRQALSDRLNELGLTQKPKLFFYEAALIIETGNAKNFLAVLATYCPRSTQLARLQARDGIDLQQAEASLASQMPADEKARLATLTIATDCSLSELEQRVAEAISHLPRV